MKLLVEMDILDSIFGCRKRDDKAVAVLERNVLCSMGFSNMYRSTVAARSGGFVSQFLSESNILGFADSSVNNKQNY